jgi:hypothetical protein
MSERCASITRILLDYNDVFRRNRLAWRVSGRDVVLADFVTCIVGVLAWHCVKERREGVGLGSEQASVGTSNAEGQAINPITDLRIWRRIAVAWDRLQRVAGWPMKRSPLANDSANANVS